MEVISVFEDYASELKSWKVHEENLYSFRNIVGKNNFELSSEGVLVVKHFIGFYSKGNTRLQVLPKIYSNTSALANTQKEINSSLKFIYKLLSETGYFKFIGLQPQSISENDNDLLEIFISIFANKMIDLLGRKVFKEYIQVEENQSLIKGKVLFADTIRKNAGYHHLHFVRFEEHSTNNTLNRILKTVILKLWKVVSRRETKRTLEKCMAYLSDVDTIKLQSELFETVRFNRLNTEFEGVFELCKLFFKNRQPGLSEGNADTFCFFIPLNDLFETYLGKILKNLSGSEGTFHHHHPFEYLAASKGKNYFLLKPDYTLKLESQIKMILDAKYKYPYENDQVHIKTDDLYQLCTYALHYRCNNLFVIYPKFIDPPVNRDHIASYDIPSAFGNIYLHLIQVDFYTQSASELQENLSQIFQTAKMTQEILTGNNN